MHCGDNLPILREMADNSVDAIVTDPPAGIGFMQRDWDSDKGGRDKWIAWMSEVAAECLRVIKPGGHALVWALPRTSHWTATAWENAGWEPRDRICHIFGSGFPKSANISKQIDRMAGAKREVVSEWRTGFSGTLGGKAALGGLNGAADVCVVTAPATDAAKQWDGWGTALKPAVEDYWLFRKPIEKGLNIAQNVLKWGTGGLNVDGCRVETNGEKPRGRGNPVKNASREAIQPGRSGGNGGNTTSELGRFPANLIHDGSDEVVGLFPVTTTGDTKAIPYTNTSGKNVFGKQMGIKRAMKGDTGSAARFFYCAKPGKSERDAGLEELAEEWFDSAELIWDNGTITTLQEVWLWENQGQNLNLDLAGEALPIKGIFEGTTGLLEGSDLHTSWNGSDTAALSLTSIKCITSTGTSLTIESKTLNLLARLSISGNMEGAIRMGLEIGLSLVESVALRNLLKAITTSGGMVFPHGASPAARQTPQLISAKDVLVPKRATNIHATVKALKLMTYLCRLITPPDGLILDPFTGSGSTGCAAMLEGFRFIGMEQSPEYAEIALKRIEHWAKEADKPAKESPLPLFENLENQSE